MIVATSEGLFEVHAGGDQTGTAPFLVDRSKEPLSLCRKPDGRVLVVMAGYPEHDIRSIETGAWVAYAWGLGWTMGVTCEPSGATWAARYSDGPGLEVFDVAVGGDYATQPAFAANVIGDSFQRSSTGELLTMSSPVSSSPTGIYLLDDSFQPSSPDAFVEGNTQSFATLGGALLAAIPNGLIKDVSAGGSVSAAPTFATLPPQTTLLFARWEKLWAAQIESPFTRIYDITAGGTFGPGQEFVVVNGGIRGLVIVPACGNGDLEAEEACDDGNTADDDGCDQTCQLEPPTGTGGAGGGGGATVAEGGGGAGDGGSLEAAGGGGSMAVGGSTASAGGATNGGGSPGSASGDGESDGATGDGCTCGSPRPKRTVGFAWALVVAGLLWRRSHPRR